MNLKALGAALAVVLMVGAACSNGDDDDSAPAGSGAGADEAVAEPSGGSTADDAGAASDTTQATDADGAAVEGDPLATVRADLPADIVDRRLVPLRLDVLRLDRTGDLIELDMLLTNEAQPVGEDAPGFTPWATFSDGPNGTDLSGLGLMVSGEQKLYLPVFDSEGGCLCTVNLSAVSVPAGEALPLNATFGGVPDDVDRLDLRIPSFPIIEGLGVGG